MCAGEIRRLWVLKLAAFTLGAALTAEPARAGARGAPDFNRDGFGDLPIGVPQENVSSRSEAGAVAVIYGSASGLRSSGDQFISQNTTSVPNRAHTGDQFGSAFAWGDFDGDGYDDLAIGAPFEDVRGVVNAGAVNVLYGSAAGLKGADSQVWMQNSSGILDACEPGDQFGASLTSGDFDGDGFADLAIGVPGESIGGFSRAGAVNVLYGSPSGLRSFANQFWSQNTSSVLGEARMNEQFGQSLAAGDFDHDGVDDLAIGAPGEEFELFTNAGAVNVLYGQDGSGLNAFADQLWNQNSFGMPDQPHRDDVFGSSLAVGDFDGDGNDDLAIGVPGEDIDGVFQNEGAVVILYGRSTNGLGGSGVQFFSQDSSQVPGIPLATDHFGQAIASGDFDGDGFDDLAIGTPLDDFGSATQCGTVIILFGQSTGLTGAGSQIWGQSTAGIADQSEGGDGFGSAVLAGDFDDDGHFDLAIGVPGEAIGNVFGAGAVNVIYGSDNGLTSSGNQFWHQNSSGINQAINPSDAFGRSLGAGRVFIPN